MATSAATVIQRVETFKVDLIKFGAKTNDIFIKLQNGQEVKQSDWVLAVSGLVKLMTDYKKHGVT